MTEDSKEKKPLRLSGSGKLEMKNLFLHPGRLDRAFHMEDLRL